jgi:tripartite-type tricarboxylate transporter receptor subunit TctC
MKRLASLLALGLALTLGAPAHAQDFPNRPVRIVVGFAAGGGVDVTARLIANKLTTLWGQPVVVENRAGASGFIGADLVAKAPPDGYAVVMSVPNSHTIGPHLVKPPYDPLRDFTPITLLITFPNVLVVGNSIPVNSMAELVTLDRTKPGSLNFASSGIGSTQHLAGEMFNLAAGTRAVHVPYKGSAAAMVDLIAGAVTFSFDTATGTIPQIRGGKLKPLAVTSRKRIAALPSVPTTAEAGYPAVEMSTWYGLEGPPGLPKPILDKWHRDVVKVLQMPDVRARIEEIAGEPVGNSPDEFRAYLENEYQRMGKLAKDAKLKAD